jgi:hypothetical protein
MKKQFNSKAVPKEQRSETEVSIPCNNNINGVVLARSNYKETLNYSHEPSKELNKPEYNIHSSASFQE